MNKPSVPPWPADKVERRPIGSLRPDPKNERTHTDEQIDQVAAAIREWGWTMPILVDEDGQIIAGEGRWRGAQRLGLAEVPVMVATGWSPEQKRAYRIADNKIAENAGWDEGLLKLELSALQDIGFDVGMIGFSGDELSALFADPGQSSGGGLGSLAEQFGVPPFSVLNAREGWWQDRKRAWLALGIQSELGRGETQTYHDGAKLGQGGLADQVADAAKRRKANAIPGGSRWPTVNPKTRKIARSDSKGRVIPGTDAKGKRRGRKA